ncbi:MAG: phosphate acetyltransferase [Treponemataceae bacterium]|nr:MAG: phosphate acetyltransferase [Treponemataceae bacterium]
MPKFSEVMKEKAKLAGKRLVLPEGTEGRTIAAAAQIAGQKIASEVILLGKRHEIQEEASKMGVSLSGITLMNPRKSELTAEFAHEYYELRKHKGMTEDVAQTEIRDLMRFGAMLVRKGKADAMVSGARSPTADVIRAGLSIIGTAKGVRTATSCFVMDMHNPGWGKEGLMLFSDCSVIPIPSTDQLVDIAYLSSRFFEQMIGGQPVVAMLSFSTKGSAGTNEDVTRIHNAVSLAHEKYPDLLLDGEMQVDAALIPEITERKSPGSPIKGKVNILVFPSLNAGNVGYKLVQRFAGADAYGPFLQGFAKPISDLSRGCSVDDIVATSAVTLVETGL